MVWAGWRWEAKKSPRWEAPGLGAGAELGISGRQGWVDLILKNLI
jgi:hypothetical protein